MLRTTAFLLILIMLAGCTTKPRVQVDGGATQSRAGGRIFFTQPF